MNKYNLVVIPFLIFYMPFMLFAQENAEQSEQPARVELRIDLPFFDLPFQVHSMDAMGHGFFNTYTSLSMNQSLAITTGVYSAIHFGARQLRDSLNIDTQLRNAVYFGVTAAGILAFTYVLPFGNTWMSQEFHRAILSLNGVPSYNGSMNILNPRWVTGFTDDELGDFKATAPHDFIRMHSAGTEALTLFGDRIMRKYFFHNTDNLIWVTALLSSLMSYSMTSTMIIYNAGLPLFDIDAEIEAMQRRDRGQRHRSFAAFDAINWVYELFRPDEPFADRGAHPSGDGSVARYITISQLTDEEREFLTRQSWLSFLNFASPMLFGRRSFSLGDTGWEWNFALRHYLTSFGSNVTATAFLKNELFNMAFTFHNNQNHRNYFPAIEAELIEFPVNLGGQNFYLSPRILLGTQPRGQEFRTSRHEFLGLFGLRIDHRATGNLFPYIDFTAKTNGWVAGNEFLNSNVSIRMGLSLRF